MRSSSGEYFVALDHVRALAAFLVFSWHFLLGIGGHSGSPPVFPLYFVTEGHTGVALFMVLSGYLFAKLLSGKQIIYRNFIFNRLLRLFPLLALVVLVRVLHTFVKGEDVIAYLEAIIVGVVLPTLPNGGWSITVELHFYLLLPVLLGATRRWKYTAIVVLAAALILRTFLYHQLGHIHPLAYLTLVGRIDQFVLGITGYHLRVFVTRKRWFAALIAVLFAIYYWLFQGKGGYFAATAYPVGSPIWIYMPTVEGAAYATLIAWYDNSFSHRGGTLSEIVAKIGSWSYSIYLLHPFVVFRTARFVHEHVLDLSNVYVAIAVATCCFAPMAAIASLSYRFVETPFLRFRRRYVAAEPEGRGAGAAEGHRDRARRVAS